MTIRPSASPRRYLALFLPLLSADRWLRERHESSGTVFPTGFGAAPLHPETVPEMLPPIAFTEKVRGAMRVVAVNEVALALGVVPGMALADARARLPDLAVVPHDPAADLALLEALADDCERYSPSVALDVPDGILIDITGCAHIWESEAGLVSDMAARLVHEGFTIRIALAETPDRARALARHGGELVRAGRGLPPGQVQEERATYHAPLPIAALDLVEAAETALRRAGLYTIDDLAARPRGPLAARFGQAVVTRLARVLGEEDAHLTPRRTLPALAFTHRFAEPVARTPYILGVIETLAQDASEALRERHQGGRRFHVQLFRSDGTVHRLAVATGGPTRDPVLLMRLVRERIDALADPLDPGFGYDLIRLDVDDTQPLAPAQSALDGETRTDTARLETLLDRLAVRLGPQRVRRFVFGDSHIPECAGFTAAAQAAQYELDINPRHPEPVERLLLAGRAKGRTVLRQAQDAGLNEPPLRPLHLFDPPQRVDVIAEVPDGPPRRFRWRRGTHDVIASEGPERIAAEWWKRKDGAGLTRDYYRVEDSQGRRFWLFRHGLYGAEKANPDWYLHGAFA